MRHLCSMCLVLAFACRPVEEDAGPQIAVDACVTNETEDCAIDFGERDVSVLVQQSLTVSNASLTSPLSILNVELIGDPAFQLVERPDVIAPRSSGVLVVTVRPNVEAALETLLLLLSDATNGPDVSEDGSVISVRAKVTGVNNGVPDIGVDPAACAFDDATTVCSLTIRNDGNRELTIDELRLACEGAECPFSVDGPTPASVAAGDDLVVNVSYAPAAGAVDGTLTILSSDPDESFVEIALTTAQ